jgi:Flp pilus assembly protein TadB
MFSKTSGSQEWRYFILSTWRVATLFRFDHIWSKVTRTGRMRHAILRLDKPPDLLREGTLSALRSQHPDWATDCPYPTRGKNMPLINLVITLIVVGVLLWLINRYIPMASSIKSILNVVVVLVVVVWLLQAVGLWAGISSFRVGR